MWKLIVLDVFSSRYRYLTIESMLEKYIEKRPVSEKTALYQFDRPLVFF